jgi:putative ABC transport system permease protein
MGLPDIVSAIPVYQEGANWLNPQGHLLRGVFVIGFDLAKPPFRHTGMNRQIAKLRRRDTILVDSQSRKMFGPLTPGRVVELQGRSETIAGTYALGTGFLGLAVAVVSDVNFLRIFPHHHLSEVNLGLIRLRPGADPDRVAAQLRALLPRDTRVFTRRQLYEHEKRYWTVHTAVGPIFGFGVGVAIIVGMVILYQMLATQISRYLSQYATLKALGYTNRDLVEIIVGMAILMWAVVVGPATLAALGIYHVAAKATLLPLFMTAGRLIGVFLLSLGMSVVSALLSIRRLIAANPAELF